jgi:hypothetical protein
MSFIYRMKDILAKKPMKNHPSPVESGFDDFINKNREWTICKTNGM